MDNGNGNDDDDDDNNDKEFNKPIPNGLPGIPNQSDIGRWRDIIEKAHGGSDAELCGLKLDKDGFLQGIFRAKKKPE